MSEPETICDDCSTPLPLDESQTCETCGVTACNDCYATQHSPCVA